METPVETLVDFTDTVTATESETTAQSMTDEMIGEIHSGTEDQDELPNTLRLSSMKNMQLRVESQRHLSVPFGDVSIFHIALRTANQAVDEASDVEYYDDITTDEKPVVEDTTPQEQGQELPLAVGEERESSASAIPLDPEPASQPAPEVYTPPPKSTQDAPVVSLDEIHEFLYRKIADNQCSSHAKEIHEFIGAHLNDSQQRQVLPPLFAQLAQRFQDEAGKLGLDEVAIDVQSSLCLMEQMFLTLGRVSPLQDMYTAEEEAMLDQLGHGNSSNNDS